MKRASLLLLVLVVLAVLSGGVSAQEESPAENACNPGGLMEGKCDTEWEWECGYYLAQFFEGKIASVPATCQSLVNTLPANFQRSGANIYVPPYTPEAGSAGDNACNPGGSMAGSCNSEWAWTCGWYIARYDAGVVTSVPRTCQILLDLRPQRPATTAGTTASGPVCIITTTALPVGSKVCMSGNVYTVDVAPPDGIIDFTAIFLTDTVAGNSGGCAAIGRLWLFDIIGFPLEIITFVASLGFPSTGDRCV